MIYIQLTGIISNILNNKYIKAMIADKHMFKDETLFF